MEETTMKPNDMFVALLHKPDVNIFDLASSDIIPSNTQLLTPDKYKESNKVQEMFKTPEGKFDDELFNKMYSKSAELYLQLGSDKALATALEWDPNDFTAPLHGKHMDVRPTATKDINPFENLYGRTGVNSIDEGNLALRELAQKSKIYDTKEKKWSDKSANDIGFFGSMIGETLVYAKWDEDGEAYDSLTGAMQKHSKGDWKYDEDGKLYVETLGDREIYGKQVVNPMDLMTREGSAINKVDFFDSDGKDKSITGTTIKLATEIAPLLIPVFNVWYGGFKMATGLASILPTFYKAGEGLFLGDSDGVETGMWKAMNASEGFMAKFTDRGVSDAAQQSMWNYEQLGNIVTDVFSQIYEQRAAASLSTLFYKTNDSAYLEKLVDKTTDMLQNAARGGLITDTKEATKIATQALGKVTSAKELASKRSLLAKNLSLGYMALSQSADVYGQALESGYDRRAAGFTALLAASGQYALMSNNNMGTWFLDKTTGYTEGVSRAQINRYALSSLDDVAKGLDNFKVDEVVGKRQLGSIFSKFKGKVNKLFVEPIETNVIAERMFQHAVIEGVEEATEEAAIDAAKGITDFMSYMGYTAKKGSFGGFDNVFSKSGLERYLASFIGGAIGGPMFELERSVITPLMTGNDVMRSTSIDIYDIVSTGRTKEFLEAVDKLKGRFGSTELSPIATEFNGEKIVLPATGISQADVIADQVKEYAKHVDKIVNLENLGNTDEDIVKKSIMDYLYIRDLKKSGVDKFLISDVKQIGEEITVLSQEMQAVAAKEGSGGEEGAKATERKKELMSKINEKRIQFTDIITGAKSEYYHKLSIFALNPLLHSPFLSLNVDEYVKETYNEDYYSLPEESKKAREKEFRQLVDTNESNFKNKMKMMYNAFLKINEGFSKSMKDFDADGYASVRSGMYSMLHNIPDRMEGLKPDQIAYEEPVDGQKYPIYKALERLNEVNRSLIKNGFKNVSLDTQTDISVGKFLVDSGFLHLLPNNEQKQVISQKYFEELASHIGITKEEGEDINAFASRVKEEYKAGTNQLLFHNSILDKLEKEFPNISSKTIFEFLALVKNSTLTDEEKSYIYSKYSEFIMLGDMLNKIDILLAKMEDPTYVPTAEELAEIGLSGTTTYQELEVLYADILIKFNAMKDAQVDLAKDTKFADIVSRRTTEMNKQSKISDIEKEAIIQQLDRIGLPSTEFNLKVLKEQIDKINLENEETIQFGINQLNATQLSAEEKLQGILELKNMTALPNFGIKDYDENSEKILNPRRAFLIQYGEQVMKDKAGIDNELVRELEKERETLIDFLTGVEEESEEYDTANEQLARIDAILGYDNRKINTLYDKLKEFEIELFGWTGPVSIFSLLKENVEFFDSKTNVSEFKRTEIQLEQIKKGLYVLRAAKAVATAMATTELSPGNLYGMNVALNKALEKEGEKPLYDLVTSEASYIIMKDINAIEDKLDYLKTLAENNSATITENNMKIQRAMISGIAKQSLDKNSKLSLVNLKVNGHSLISSDDLIEINKIEDEELQLVEIEHTFYKNFHKIALPLEEKLDLLFTQFIPEEGKEEAIKSLLGSRDSKLVESFNKLEALDWYKHIHYILASNIQEFYIKHKNNVEKELSLTNQKAPLYTQQFVLRETQGYFEDKTTVSHMVSFLQKNIEDAVKDMPDSDFKKKVIALQNEINKVSNFPIKNVLAIRGSGGTGKSSVLGNWTLRTLIDSKMLSDTMEIVAVAPNQDTLEILSKDLKGEISNTITSKTKESFLQSIIRPEGILKLQELEKVFTENKLSKDLNDSLVDPKYFVIGEGDGAVLITKEFYKEFLYKFDDTAAPRIVIMDEMSKFTTLEWQIFNEISESNKTEEKEYDSFYIVLMGDELQNGVLLGNNNFSLENILSPTTTKLKSPVRARNNHRNNNNITAEDFVENWNHALLHENRNYKMDITFTYSEREGDFLAGDKFTDNLSENDLKKLDSNKEIVIIGKPTEDQEVMIKKLFPMKEIKTYPADVQGREFDQTIILTNFYDNTSGDKYLEAKNLYTLLSRSKEASIVVGKTNFHINNEKLGSSTSFGIDEHIVKASLEERLKVLNDLISKFSKEKSEKTKEVLVSKVQVEGESPINLEENQKDDELDYTNQGVSEKLPQENSLAYSFYNNLGVTGDSHLEYLEYIVSDETDESDPYNKKITWDDLLSRIGTITGTDFFSLPYQYIADKKLFELINEYVAFKNNMLFATTPDTLLNMNFTASDAFYLKRLDVFGDSYKKLVRSSKINSPIYVIGKYLTFADGTKVFVTSAVMPDKTNPKVIANLDIAKLENIYSTVDKAKNSEIEINSDALILNYGGIQVPKHEDETTKINPIHVSDITKEFPGVEVSEIRVFRNDINFIREEFAKYETTPEKAGMFPPIGGTPVSPAETKKRQWSKYRFRPYVIVSYVKGNSRFSKLVILQADKRNLKTLWAELQDSQKAKESTEVEVDNSPTKTAHLISKYRGWELLYQFFESLEDRQEREEMAQWINENFMGGNQNRGNSWAPFQSVLDAFTRLNPNTPYDKFIEAQNGIVKKIIINASDKEAADLKISNPILIAYQLTTGENDFKAKWDKFMEEKGDEIIIHYNTIITSPKLSSKKGETFGYLPDSQKQYYTMGYAVEPNQLLVNMDKLIPQTATPKKTKATMTTSTNDPLGNKVLKYEYLNEDGTNTIYSLLNIGAAPGIPVLFAPHIPEADREKLRETMDYYAILNVQSNTWQLNPDVNEVQSEDEIPIKPLLGSIYNSLNYKKTSSGSYVPTTSAILKESTRIQTKCSWQ